VSGNIGIEWPENADYLPENEASAVHENFCGKELAVHHADL
jgi:hypothetical protein